MWGADEDRARIKRWMALGGFEKKCYLMYLYRLKTDPEGILGYEESHLFIRTGICPTDLPLYLLRESPQNLEKEAKKVLGRR